MKLEEDNVVFYDKDMPDKKLHLNNGKEEATFEKLFEPLITPYLKKSNGEEKEDPKPKETKTKEYADLNENERHVLAVRRAAEQQ